MHQSKYIDRMTAIAFALAFVLFAGLLLYSNGVINKESVPNLSQPMQQENIEGVLSASLNGSLSRLGTLSMPDMELASAKMPVQQSAGSVSKSSPANPLYRVYRTVWYTAKTSTWHVRAQWYKNMRPGECSRLRAQARNSRASCRIYFTYKSDMKRVYGPRSASSLSKAFSGATPQIAMPWGCSWEWWGQNSIRVQSVLWFATVYSQFYTDDKAGCNLVNFTRVSCLNGGALWAVDHKKCEANPKTNEAFRWSDVEFGQEFTTSFMIKDQGPINFRHASWAHIDPHTGALVNIDFH